MATIISMDLERFLYNIKYAVQSVLSAIPPILCFLGVLLVLGLIFEVLELIYFYLKTLFENNPNVSG